MNKRLWCCYLCLEFFKLITRQLHKYLLHLNSLSQIEFSFAFHQPFNYIPIERQHFTIYFHRIKWIWIFLTCHFVRNRYELWVDLEFHLIYVDWNCLMDFYRQIHHRTQLARLCLTATLSFFMVANFIWIWSTLLYTHSMTRVFFLLAQFANQFW